MSSVTNNTSLPSGHAGSTAVPGEKDPFVSESICNKLKCLNVINNFLFTTISTTPDVAEPFFRIVLRTIFGFDFPEITVTAQKVIQAVDTNLHGIRVDALVETPTDSRSGRATIYNIEAETREKNKKSLPRRGRYYSDLYDVNHFPSGASYLSLPDYISIIILSYDPFEQGDLFYESRSCLTSHPGLPYDDGLRRIYLYADGKLNEDAIRNAGLGDGKTLQNMVKYMCHSNPDNVSTSVTQEMDTLVANIKSRREVGISYMMFLDYIESLKQDFKDEGLLEQSLHDAVFHISSSRKWGVPEEEILRDLTGHFALSDEDARKLLAGEPVSAIFEEKPLPV